VSDSPHREEFLAGYVAESQEHLAAARKSALAADEAIRLGQPAPRPTRELFRALHTLKGLSGMIGVEPIVDIAHEMEAVLRAADRAGGRLRQDALDMLVAGIAAIEDRVERVARGEPVPAAPKALVESLQALEVPARQGPVRSTDLPEDLARKLAPADLEQIFSGISEGRRAFRIDFVPSVERAARGLDITAARQRVERTAEIVKVVPRSAPRDEAAPAGLVFVLVVLTSASPEDLAAAIEATAEAVREIHVASASAAGAEPDAGADADADAPAEEGSHAARAFVRVDVRRLDEALDRVSALIVSRSRLVRAVDALSTSGTDVRSLRPILEDHARELRSLRAAVMRARLVRMSEVLERAPLLVRGLAQTSGKQVRLALVVGESEVDKAVGERLFPAIIHLLRNAVDHAIEPPQERRSLGKPVEGTIRIASSHRGEGQLEIVVSDDGRGIDVASVAAKAGVPPPSTGAEILALIARPGLTTMAAPSRTSGRGIGMDVVRRVVVTDLGGTLDVSSTGGLGTAFTLRIPLSLTIVDGLTFECAGETYVVPTAAVDELVELQPTGLVAGPRPARAGPPVLMLRWRDESVPYFELRDLLGLRRPGEARRGIIVRRNGAAFGFGVDRMIGRQEVVIRPLTDPLVERVGIAGATDLGDGRPTLVLDLGALAGAAVTQEGG
jgi:two-component system chemotaxis sensor kinase CheA